MTSIIYLVRHAESAHNVSKDFSHKDPPLTDLGQKQASALVQSFPKLASVAVVLTSPLVRTLETTLAGFSHILDKTFTGETGSNDGARLILEPDLQERSDEPCDIGSDRATLERRFPGLDFSTLEDNWYAKEGKYSADDDSVSARAERVRQRLADLEKDLASVSEERRNVVVVTHGVFMKFLSEDWTIDLPKAGWKAFTVVTGNEGKAILRPVE